MEMRSTPPRGARADSSPSLEEDIEAVARAMRFLGQPHGRRLRALLEAKVETRAELQSAR